MADIAAVVLATIGPASTAATGDSDDSKPAVAAVAISPSVSDMTPPLPLPPRPSLSARGCGPSLPNAFWAFDGVLVDSAPNWSQDELRGVWMQASTERRLQSCCTFSPAR